MRHLLRILAFAAFCTAAHAATFTAVQSGDWQANTTWGTAAGAVCGTNFPCKGDQAVIPSTFTVTCGLTVQETCSAGTSPADNVTLAISVTAASGGLTCAHASTIIYAGPVTVADGNTFTVGAGCIIQHDSSSAAAPTNPAAQGGGYAWKGGSSVLGATYNMLGTSGSHITWQGDSCLASTANATTCGVAGACLTQQCPAGGINYVTGGLLVQVGNGTLTYVDFKNIKGNTNGSTTIAWLSNTGSTSSLGGMTYSNLTFTHSGTMRVTVATDTDINPIAISNVAFTDCVSTSSADGCLRYGSVGTATNGGSTSYVITGVTADGPIGTAGGAASGAIVLRNAFAWSGTLGGIPHNAPGFPNAADGALKDQYFVDDNGWNSGGAQTSMTTWLGINTTNSIFWQDRVPGSTIHMNFVKMLFSNSGSGQNGTVSNTVFGGLGSIDSSGHGSDQSGGTPAAGATYLFNGNVEVAGYNGFCTTPMPGGHYASATSNLVATTIRGNTLCQTVNSASDGLQITAGSSAMETSVMAAGTIASIDSNLFFNALSGGGAMAAVESVNNTNASTTTIAYLGGNAVVNDTSYQQQYGVTNAMTSVANASAGSTVYTGTFPDGAASNLLNMKAAITGFANGVNNGTFVISASTTTTITVNNASGAAESHAASAVITLNYVQTLGTDTTYTAAAHGALRAVNNVRSLPFFDVDYLDPAGLLLVSSYSASAWVTSHSYSVGDVVFVDSSVSGYAAVYGGKRSYWRCVQAHTSGATNQPIIAVDGSNPFQEHAAFWEEAYFNYFRTQVVANTDFTAQCKGLLFVTCPTTTYITGLLNAWLREGYVSIDPSLWNGCVAGNGGAVVECGALPLKPIQHIPPPASVL